MKKGFVIGVVLAGIFTFMACDAMAKTDKAAKINAVSRLSHAGDVYGNVSCFQTDPLPGIVVYIPGTSFMAVTDANGDFAIFNVPKGTYNLEADTDGNLSTSEGLVINGFTVVGKLRNKVCP